MSKGLKIFLVIFFVIPIIAFAIMIFKTGQTNPVLAEILGLKSTPSSYNLGEVPRTGGIISKEFAIKNTTDKTLKLYKITTSCMCTKAKVVLGDKETNYFGLEHQGDQNAPVNLEIAPEQEAKVVFQFDPDAHGSQGVGAFDRSIELIFSDPQTVKELKFNGTVVEK
jgi:hypothetical protein